MTPANPTLSFEDIERELRSRLGVRPENGFPVALERLNLSINPAKVVCASDLGGRGEAAAMLHHLLVHSGLTAGLFSYPPLEDPTDCFRTSETSKAGAALPISKDDFLKSFAKVNALTFDVPLTHQETLLLVALWIFFSGEFGSFDWVILEGVWEGGGFSAARIPHASSILGSPSGVTAEALLGFASQQFQLIQKGNRVYHAPFPEDMLRLMSKAEGELQCRFVGVRGFSVMTARGRFGEAPKFTLKTEWGQTELVSPGRRGGQNAALALTVYDGLGYSTRHALEELASFRWPGRMERLADPKSPCPVYLSAESTPEGVRGVMEILPDYARDRIFIVLAVDAAQDPGAVLRPFFDLPNATIALTEAPGPGLRLGDAGDWVDRAAYAHPDPREAYAAVLSLAKKKDLILVTGSLGLVGEIRKSLGQHQKSR